MNSVRFLNVEYFYTRVIDFFQQLDIIAILNFIIKILKFITPIGIIVSLLLLYIVFYSKGKLKQMVKEDEEKKKASALASSATMKPKEITKESVASAVSQDVPSNLPGSEPVADSAQADMELHEKWQLVQKSLNSNNPSDWRVAILEADIMLGDILTKRGYRGATIGDQLKSVDPSDMLTLNDAWEAHKVRNQIAHGGSTFQLNEREVRRTIDLYKKVFSEFYHI